MDNKPNDVDAAIARNIKEHRKSADLTQPQVARFLGMSFQSFQKLESGKTRVRVGILDQLSQLFDIPIQNLLIPDDVGGIDPRKATLNSVFSELSDDGKSALEAAAIKIKRDFCDT